MDREALAQLLVGIIESRTKQTIPPELYGADLGRLGIDSVLAIDIANEIEDALDITIDDRDIYRFRTVNAILDYFAHREGAGARA